jgi:phosphate/sulfate permease
MFGLDPFLTILLILCIVSVCAFEFVNGFHDTANAVATVIYTKSLKPMEAVMLSGILNFVGVLTGGIAVAMGIVKLLPLEALTEQTTYQMVAMILSILLTAIIWNFGTWFFGIPCSSSHTLLASILGACVAFSMMPEAHGAAVQWGKAGEIGLSLLLSPLVGFLLTLLIMFILKLTVKNANIFKEPEPGKKTPNWIRSILILTCSGVSFAHGSNDGQKGVGLLMLVLIALAPAQFALNSDLDLIDIKTNAQKVQTYVSYMNKTTFSKEDGIAFESAGKSVADVIGIFEVSETTKRELTIKEKVMVRKNIMTACKNFEMLEDRGYDKEFDKLISANIANADYKKFKKSVGQLKEFTEYVPKSKWPLFLIAICLGIGTTVGWKRIVVTMGEKIGKQHLTYAQGASAELSAATTIAFSTFVMKLPVSTTQILSSGIAGAMVGSKGVGNLNPATLKNIGLAWVLTFPVCVTLSGTLFFLLRMLA